MFSYLEEQVCFIFSPVTGNTEEKKLCSQFILELFLVQPVVTLVLMGGFNATTVTSFIERSVY